MLFTSYLRGIDNLHSWVKLNKLNYLNFGLIKLIVCSVICIVPVKLLFIVIRLLLTIKFSETEKKMDFFCGIVTCGRSAEYAIKIVDGSFYLSKNKYFLWNETKLINIQISIFLNSARENYECTTFQAVR